MKLFIGTLDGIIVKRYIYHHAYDIHKQLSIAEDDRSKTYPQEGIQTKTKQTKMKWSIEKRKQGNEIWVTSNAKDSDPDIFIGEGYEKKERKRSMELAKVIEKALNEHQ
jgi:hypothetical protein